MHDKNRWKERRNILIHEGFEDPRQWFRIGKDLIQEFDDEVYGNFKKVENG